MSKRGKVIDDFVNAVGGIGISADTVFRGWRIAVYANPCMFLGYLTIDNDYKRNNPVLLNTRAQAREFIRDIKLELAVGNPVALVDRTYKFVPRKSMVSLHTLPCRLSASIPF